MTDLLCTNIRQCRLAFLIRHGVALGEITHKGTGFSVWSTVALKVMVSATVDRCTKSNGERKVLIYGELMNYEPGIKPGILHVQIVVDVQTLFLFDIHDSFHNTHERIAFSLIVRVFGF